MKSIAQYIVERLILRKNNNRDDFNVISKILDGRSLDLERIFSGKNKNVNKTRANDTIWFLDNNPKDGSFELLCSDKYGNSSDAGTIRNNDDLYNFLSTRLKNSTPTEFINILIDYLQDHFVQENVNERLVLSKTRKIDTLYDNLFKKLQEWSPMGFADVYFERIYDNTRTVVIDNIEYDLESIGWRKEDNCIELSTYPSKGKTTLQLWYIKNDEDLLKYLGGDFEDEEFVEECVKNLIAYMELRIKTRNKK